MGKEYSTRVAARFYKAPELLLGNGFYDYSIDIWALGCIFAAIMFQQEIFFKGNNEADQLLCIAKVVGTDEIINYVNDHNLKKSGCTKLGKQPKKSWSKFKTVCNDGYVTDDAIDLLAKMLVVEHTKRIMAKDAMNHPYFKDLIN